MLEATLRTFAGESRVQNTTRLDSADFGRVLRLDQEPETLPFAVNTTHLSGLNKSRAPMSLIAAGHLTVCGAQKKT